MFEGPMVTRTWTVYQAAQAIANELSVLEALVDLSELERLAWLEARCSELRRHLENRRNGVQELF